jgi:hypothetical protein
VHEGDSGGVQGSVSVAVPCFCLGNPCLGRGTRHRTIYVCKILRPPPLAKLEFSQIFSFWLEEAFQSVSRLSQIFHKLPILNYILWILLKN